MKTLRNMAGLFVLGMVLGGGWAVIEPSYAAMPGRALRSSASVGSEGTVDGARRATPPDPSDSRPPLRALLLGNGFSRWHRLPELIARFAREDGQPRFDVVVDAPGEFSLGKHVEAGRYQQHLAEGKFDALLLQEHTMEPSYAAARRRQRMYAAATTLHERARLAGARSVLIMTPARRDGDQRRTGGDTYTAMQGRVEAAYRQLGAQLGADVAPVGTAWRIARSRHPDWPLWEANGSSPARLGVYLMGAVLYSRLYGRAVKDLDFDAKLDPAHTAIVRGIVDEVLAAEGGPPAPAPVAAGPAGSLAAPTGEVALIGILRPKDGVCLPGYELLEAVCFHPGLTDDPAERARLIGNYKAGRPPPIVQR